jgi:hypothetical protein
LAERETEQVLSAVEQTVGVQTRAPVTAPPGSTIPSFIIAHANGLNANADELIADLAGAYGYFRERE